MKKYKICGIGNALVDILLKVSDEQLKLFGFEKATMRLVESGEQLKLLMHLEDLQSRGDGGALASGGSVANSIAAFAQLGGKASYIGSIGSDRYGTFYKEDLESIGVTVADNCIKEVQTGTSVVLITPDAERTMRTCLGAAAQLSLSEAHCAQIADAEWLFIEGYLLANPEYGVPSVLRAVAAAREAGTKIALTCSEPFVVNVFREHVDAIIGAVDLLFANSEEACALARVTDSGEAFELLADQLPSVVVTRGGEGALVSIKGQKQMIEAFPCEPRDLTGAGDMFAGAFLYGITHGSSAADAGKRACFLASKVIENIGARLTKGTRELWDELG